MIYFLSAILLCILFYLLGKTADVVVDAIRRIASSFGIKIYFLGILLGIVTSLPELSIALNSVATGVPDVSLGNLMGSAMVILGLIFGWSILLNRGIATDGRPGHIAPLLGYLILPFLFSIDGTISRLDSFLLVLWYVWLLAFLYFEHRGMHERHAHDHLTKKIFHSEVLYAGIGLICVLVISHLIVTISELVLSTLNISGFGVGLILFAVGTNLPEITLMLGAYRKNMKDLSVSHLMGSVIADPLLIGLFGLAIPFVVPHTLVFTNVFLFTVLLIVAFILFYRSEKRFSRSEGLVLVLIYALFVVSETVLSFVIGR